MKMDCKLNNLPRLEAWQIEKKKKHARKTQCQKAWMLFRRTQIAVKPDTFTIRTCNKRFIIPKMVILKPRILYGLDRIRNLWKKWLLPPPTKGFRKFENGSFLKPFQTVLLRATTESPVFRLVWLFCHIFVDESNIHLVDFHDDVHLNDTWLFQNRITPSYIIWPGLNPFWPCKRQKS